MLSRLTVSGFRGLHEFTMGGLGRINLLVGTNNCGKTSVLEAISMLLTPGSVSQIWGTLFRRGEMHEDAEERELDVAHLFHGHGLDAGAEFTIRGGNSSIDTSLIASLRERDLSRPLNIPSTRRAQRDLFAFEVDDETATIRPLTLHLGWGGAVRRELELPMTRRGGLLVEYGDYRRGPAEFAAPVHFITTEGMTRDRVVTMFEEIVLTEQEQTVLEALRTIEPGIERIAPIGTQRGRIASARGGIAVRIDGQRIPIGSMGDGIWRLLGVALALVRSQGGILLVDEIDTGLHYSVLQKMWRLVHQTATLLDVQVFATTHSRDCYESLAAITVASRGEISLQRVEKGRREAVAFSEEELHEAANRGFEVR